MQIAICDDTQKELETIRAALDTYAKSHPELYFDIDEYVAAIDILNAVEKGKTIVSIESQNHYLVISLSSGEILRLRRKLSQMFDELQNYHGFIKVGASYVVNLAFVRRISGNTLEMFNRAQISIPRRSSEEVQKTFMDFCRKEALV